MYLQQDNKGFAFAYSEKGGGMHVYGREFYEYINRGAIASAEVVVALLAEQLSVRSIADFGCGQGAWLSVWRRFGAAETIGIDGDYVTRESLLIQPSDFVAADLGAPVRLGRTFDLVQSLEVAEHLPAPAAAQFIDSLVAHGRIVLFSAAVPGQGGENHVNERPYEYWRRLFRERRYVPLDAVRPRIVRDPVVEPWYRYNTLLYVHESRLDSMPPALTRMRIPDDAPIADLSPLKYRMRKGLLRMLPVKVVSLLATTKHRLVLRADRA